jgi:hypothetical protein
MTIVAITSVFSIFEKTPTSINYLFIYGTLNDNRIVLKTWLTRLCLDTVLKNINKTAGRLAIIEVSDSTICESGPACGMGNTCMRNVLWP